MSQTDEWTIGRLLKWTTNYFADRGADTPRLDAELLLAEVLGCQRIELYTAFDEVVGQEHRATFRELVRRRADGTPVAYLLGRREFYSLSFRVTPEVLIPRPETEFVVVAFSDLLHRRDGGPQPVEIADVGTGSGILAVCTARECPKCRVTAIDISPGALAVARANAADHGVAERIEFVQGDLLDCLDEDRRFDFVVSNPPYVSEAELADLAPDVRDREPRTALVAGVLGTEVIARLVPQAAQHLRIGGWLICEISPTIEAPTHALIDADGRFEPALTIKDLANQARVVTAKRG